MTGDNPAPRPWKGLNTSAKPVFISYDQVERMVAALVESAARWQPDEVVAIARGGLVPAAMAAGILALPLSFLTHDAATAGVSWIGAPAKGRRILLVDDCCSTGTTLRRAQEKLEEEGRDCLSLVVVHDPDVVQHVPDLSFPMRELFRLPWERGEATPTGRAAKASGANLDLSVEAPFAGLTVNEKLLAGIAAGVGLPPLPPERAVLISEFPETERARIEAVLAATPYRGLPLDCSSEPTAERKADVAIRWGCTHFIDCDAEQAIAVAGHAPHLIVSWWSVETGCGWTIGAAAQPDPTDFHLATGASSALPKASSLPHEAPARATTGPNRKPIR
jgi:hypoxanthine phosphoribosyltransferase